MGQTFDKMKMLNQLRKVQKELKKEIITVEEGDGAVKIEFTGELKVKKVSLDPEKIDFDDVAELERWIELAINKGYAETQEKVKEKTMPFMGMLGDLGL